MTAPAKSDYERAVPSYELLLGDCIETMRGLPAGIVQACVTSPPYYALRDYGTASWQGGEL